MQRGFPLDLIVLLRCPVDAGELRAIAGAAERFLVDGAFRCSRCEREYPVRDGVLSLLVAQQLHPETALEMEARDLRSAAVLDGTRREWQSAFADETEVQPTLAAVSAEPAMTICELGCGPGRYTLALAATSSSVVALDVSLAGLKVLRSKLEPLAPVALVQADVTTPVCAPRAFDRVLSTLHSNLPDREHRLAALEHVAESLKDAGRAVISMHHYSLRDALLSVPASRSLPGQRHLSLSHDGEGIARRGGPTLSAVCDMSSSTSVSQGSPSLKAARAAASLPLVRTALSRLFLAIGEQPVRRPVHA